MSSFDTVDPGTLQMGQNFFKLNAGVIDATLWDIGVSVLDAAQLPKNIILGAQECLDRCKIDRSTFKFTATFADYAIFFNSTWQFASALSPSTPSLSGASATTTGAA